MQKWRLFLSIIIIVPLTQKKQLHVNSPKVNSYVFHCHQSSKQASHETPVHLWLIDFDPFCLFVSICSKVFWAVLDLWLWLMAAKIATSEVAYFNDLGKEKTSAVWKFLPGLPKFFIESTSSFSNITWNWKMELTNLKTFILFNISLYRRLIIYYQLTD